MRFKLIESATGDKNRKLFNQAVKKAKEYFMSLSEQQMINILFDENNSNDITDHSSMFITSNGTILNATDYENDWYPREDQAHIDVFFNAFGKKVQEYLQGTSAENLLTLDSLYDKFITKLFNVQYYCISKFNWIKLNSGTMTDDNNCYITLRDTPNQIQLNAINDYLNSIYCCGHKSVQVWDNDIEPKIYPLDNEDDLQRVKDRIETYCRMGKLYESTQKISIVSRNDVLYKNLSEDILNLMCFDKKLNEVYGTYTANAISDEMINKHQVDIRGLKINTNQDLQALVLAFRDKRYETFRILYCKDDLIVGSDNITSKLVDSCPFVKKFNSSDDDIQKEIKSFYFYKQKAMKLNANQIYIVHNHPSNDKDFSYNDRMISRLFKECFDTIYSGHFLIYDTQISFMKDPYGQFITLTDIADNSIPSMQNNLLGYQILSKDNKISLAKGVSSEDYSTVIYLDNSIEVTAMQEINNSHFNNSQIYKHIHNQMPLNGAKYAIIVTENQQIFEQACEYPNRNYIMDVLLVNKNEVTTMRQFLNKNI